MYVLLLFVIALSIQTPSPTVKTVNPITKNGTSTGGKGNAKDNSKDALPPFDSQNIGVPSAPQKQGAKDDEKDQTHDGVYKVDIVTPPVRPLDTKLFPLYLWITAAGVFVNALIWFSIFRQTQSNRIVATAAQDSANALKGAERPWIFVTVKNGIQDRHNEAGETFMYFEWFLTNHGKTPAFVCEIQAAFEILTETQLGEIRDKGVPDNTQKLREDSFIVASIPHDCQGVSMTKAFTNVERAAIKDGKSFYVAYGVVRYKDIFGEGVHQTPFLGFRGDKNGVFTRLYDASFNKYS